MCFRGDLASAIFNFFMIIKFIFFSKRLHTGVSHFRNRPSWIFLGFAYFKPWRLIYLPKYKNIMHKQTAVQWCDVSIFKYWNKPHEASGKRVSHFIELPPRLLFIK